MGKALAELVRRRGGGRCEYCHSTLPPFHVEHIIARKHGGPTVSDNLAFSCASCNFFKGPNISGIDPGTGAVVLLFHPRKDNWRDHFRWHGPKLVGMNPTARATIAVLKINDEARIDGRLGEKFDERTWS
jgi:hypothetical protein